MPEPAAHHPCRLNVIPDSAFCKRLSCLSMSINLFTLEAEPRRRESQGVISCSWWTIPQPVLLHPSPGAFPLNGSRTPSFFVCLRSPSCVFVDNSFFLLFQASRAPAPHDGRIIRERNRGPGWRIGSTDRFRFPSASCFVCLGRPSCVFVDNSFVCCFRQAPPLPPATGQIIRG